MDSFVSEQLPAEEVKLVVRSYFSHDDPLDDSLTATGWTDQDRHNSLSAVDQNVWNESDLRPLTWSGNSGARRCSWSPSSLGQARGDLRRASSSARNEDETSAHCLCGRKTRCWVESVFSSGFYAFIIRQEASDFCYLCIVSNNVQERTTYMN